MRAHGPSHRSPTPPPLQATQLTDYLPNTVSLHAAFPTHATVSTWNVLHPQVHPDRALLILWDLAQLLFKVFLTQPVAFPPFVTF